MTTAEQTLNDFRLTLAGRELVPLMQGGMGVNISTKAMALAVAAKGGIGHVSDAMLPDLVDRLFHTGFTKMKAGICRSLGEAADKARFLFPVEEVRTAAARYISDVMRDKTGNGLVFVNVMEKLNMNESLATLKARLLGALDGGVDGLSLSAGLHTSSFALMAEHPRFHEAMLGIVVSSARALGLFLKRAAKTGRMPDYVVVEGPLAGGHLGFGMDWMKFNLADIVREVKAFLEAQGLSIPVLAGGGIFTGTQAVRMIKEAGAEGVQVATRFAVTKESGLPDEVKQKYFDAQAEDIVVNAVSPTGYPMRMLRQSPAINANLKPQCGPYGYMLSHGRCAYLEAWQKACSEGRLEEGVPEKTCLCAQMRNCKVWTLGAMAWRLKETSHKDSDGRWVLPTTAEVFDDYCYGVRDEVCRRPIGE